jgi:DUF4097 and DUF4098 domain-containing protein YvlB
MRTMRTRLALLLITVALIAVSSTIGAQNRRTSRSASTNVSGDAVNNCGDIRVTFDRQPAITEETEMSLPGSQVSALRTRLSKGGVYISGWDRSEYSVKTCKAVPDDPNATNMLRNINTASNGGGNLTVSGPSDGEWEANLIIMVPRLSTMDIETRNGPLQLRDLAGNIRLNATNGPISLRNVGGVVETTTTNGPISLVGASGDQRVAATNGPINIRLSGSLWDGPGLEASTKNGPLSISVPDAYGSGIWIQAPGNSPLNCKLAACAGVSRTLGSPNVIRIGSGDPIVRLSTSNGPLSIQAAKD